MEDELKYFSTRGGDERLTFEQVRYTTSKFLLLTFDGQLQGELTMCYNLSPTLRRPFYVV